MYVVSAGLADCQAALVPSPDATPPAPWHAPTPGVCDTHPLNMWGLEVHRFFRSPVCVSPNGHWMAYSEETFLPALRQTTAEVFLMPVPPAPPPSPPAPPSPKSTWWRLLRQPFLPLPEPPALPDFQAMRYDPQLLGQTRIPLLKLSFQPPFEFSTLQVVAWSPDSNTLTVVQHTGTLHEGWSRHRQWTIKLDKHTLFSDQLKPQPDGSYPWTQQP